MSKRSGDVIHLYLAHLISSKVAPGGFIEREKRNISIYDSSTQHAILHRQIDSRWEHEYQMFPLTLQYPPKGSTETSVKCALCDKEILIRIKSRNSVIVKRILGVLGIGYALAVIALLIIGKDTSQLFPAALQSGWIYAPLIIAFFSCLIGGPKWAFGSKVDHEIAVEMSEGVGHCLFSVMKVRRMKAERNLQDRIKDRTKKDQSIRDGNWLK